MSRKQQEKNLLNQEDLQSIKTFFSEIIEIFYFSFRYVDEKIRFWPSFREK